MDVITAELTIDLGQFPGLKFEPDLDGEDCVWVIDKYGNGEPCYDMNDLLRTVEHVYDGQQEGDFWRTPRGRQIEADENSMYE